MEKTSGIEKSKKAKKFAGLGTMFLKKVKGRDVPLQYVGSSHFILKAKREHPNKVTFAAFILA